jgi:ADP-ribose pyrophosphatase YjhB (NUDIX family)
MAQVLAGDRIGRLGRLGVGCSAALFDATRTRILLTRRSDNRHWCVPGGYMEPGESTTEACCREVLEETGVVVQVRRLISIYTNPHRLLAYPDGNRWQLVILHFEVDALGGELTCSTETTAWNYFTSAQVADLAMGNLDRLRVADAFAAQPATIIRDTF